MNLRPNSFPSCDLEKNLPRAERFFGSKRQREDRRTPWLLHMLDFKWSKGEKTAARAAFDLALARELRTIRQETEALLQNSTDEFSIWRVHDYLSTKRQEVDHKYDFRYSVLVLVLVFGRLVSEGWLTLDDLSGIGVEKIEAIQWMISRR
jgi:photoprotection regulator FRP-like protein